VEGGEKTKESCKIPAYAYLAELLVCRFIGVDRRSSAANTFSS
jgi:hypothetical protein